MPIPASFLASSRVPGLLAHECAPRMPPRHSLSSPGVLSFSCSNICAPRAGRRGQRARQGGSSGVGTRIGRRGSGASNLIGAIELGCVRLGSLEGRLVRGSCMLAVLSRPFRATDHRSPTCFPNIQDGESNARIRTRPAVDQRVAQRMSAASRPRIGHLDQSDVKPFELPAGLPRMPLPAPRPFLVASPPTPCWPFR